MSESDKLPPAPNYRRLTKKQLAERCERFDSVFANLVAMYEKELTGQKELYQGMHDTPRGYLRGLITALEFIRCTHQQLEQRRDERLRKYEEGKKP